MFFLAFNLLLLFEKTTALRFELKFLYVLLSLILRFLLLQSFLFHPLLLSSLSILLAFLLQSHLVFLFPFESERLFPAFVLFLVPSLLH